MAALGVVTVVMPVYGEELVVDDTSDRITWDGGSWTVASDARLLGGTEHVSSEVGARATLAFSGDGVAVIYRTGRDLAIVSVEIDDRLVGNIDQYGPEEFGRVTSFAVGPGEHTISVANSGGRHREATGWGIAIDAFVIEASDGEAVSRTEG
jgi:hypothetical protein